MRKLVLFFVALLCFGITMHAQNLIYNGDFELGNVGFYTSYEYSTDLFPAGHYYIGNDAHDYHRNFYGIDHTTGTGMFMIINGAQNINDTVWSQSLTVEGNSLYHFSFYACALNSSGPAQLTISFNDLLTSTDTLLGPLEIDIWQKYEIDWESINNTTVTIKILNQNTNWGGNDFGLDDIHCVRDTTTITDVIIIEGQEITKRIYPNPASFILNIELSSTIINKIELFNEFGALVEAFEPNSSTTELDVSGYSSGIYTLKIFTLDNKVMSTPIMITH